MVTRSFADVISIWSSRSRRECAEELHREEQLLLPRDRRAAMGDSNPAAHDSTGVVGVEIDPGERRLNELGYKQELKREMVRAMLFSV